jgi:hypothetical protein
LNISEIQVKEVQSALKGCQDIVKSGAQISNQHANKRVLPSQISSISIDLPLSIFSIIEGHGESMFGFVEILFSNHFQVICTTGVINSVKPFFKGKSLYLSKLFKICYSPPQH